MNPTFTNTLRYTVNITCISPLRTGGSDRNTQEILRRRDNTPFLQGSSLAGAFRGWRDNTDLFGSPDREGSLIVSDLIFNSTETTMRPRLRIDGATGTSMHGAKFDIAALPAGTTGQFQLVWRGVENQESPKAEIEEYLSALNDNLIVLGAQKNNGFGRVRLQVCRRFYDMTRPEDRTAWLNALDDGESILLPHIQDQDTITFHITGQTRCVLVKASVGEGVGKTGVNAVQIRNDEDGSYVIPGSSIKGAIRAQVSRIAPYFHAEQEIGELFGRESGTEDNGVAGKIRFSDCQVTEAQTTKITRIRINRFTGGVIRSGLFSEAPVGGGLSWDIHIPQKETRGCGLLLFALRDLGLGLYNLGSGNAIGHGRLEWLEVDIQSKNGNAHLSCHQGTTSIGDQSGLISNWLVALKGDQFKK